MSENLKRHLLSAVITFASSFLTALGIVISSVPQDSFLSPSAWTAPAIVAILLTAARAALKATFETLLPKQNLDSGPIA